VLHAVHALAEQSEHLEPKLEPAQMRLTEG
jgi:hypothetical protein